MPYDCRSISWDSTLFLGVKPENFAPKNSQILPQKTLHKKPRFNIMKKMNKTTICLTLAFTKCLILLAIKLLVRPELSYMNKAIYCLITIITILLIWSLFQQGSEKQFKKKILTTATSVLTSSFFFELLLPSIHYDIFILSVSSHDALERNKEHINKFKEVFLNLKNNPQPEVTSEKLREVRTIISNHDCERNYTFYVRNFSIEQAAHLKLVFESEESDRLGCISNTRDFNFHKNCPSAKCLTRAGFSRYQEVYANKKDICEKLTSIINEYDKKND